MPRTRSRTAEGARNRRRWRNLAAVGAAGAIVAGLAGPLPAASADPSPTGDVAAAALVMPEPGPLPWVPCEDMPGFECAFLPVPLDYEQPDGQKIMLALNRLPASDPQRRVGSLVLNPGGPGGSGMLLVAGAGPRFPDSVRAAYDLVGFDPRFVGRSEGIVCRSSVEYSAADPASPEGVANAAEVAASVAAACYDAYGGRLAFAGTVNAARDLEMIRRALGEPKLDYLGFSYGTRLGAVYAAQFPDRVGRMVLDSALPPVSTLHRIASEGARAAEDQFNQFVRWCTSTPGCPVADPGAAFDRIRERLARDPLEPSSPDPDSPPALTVRGFLDAVFGMQGHQTAWPYLAEFLADLDSGDPTRQQAAVGVAAKVRATPLGLPGVRPLGGSFDGPDDEIVNGQTVFQMVNCQDWNDRPDVGQALDLQRSVQGFAPRLGALGVANYINSVACPNPPAPVPPINRTSLVGLPPVLVIGVATDPNTYYTWSQELAQALPESRLLTWQGNQHTAYLSNVCVNQFVDAFLLAGELPDVGATCPNNPLPTFDEPPPSGSTPAGDPSAMALAPAG